MRYLGGKSRIADWVTETLLTQRHNTTSYLEPFMGSAAIFAAMAPHYPGAAIGADSHPDLMLMWQAAKAGWVPPYYVTREKIDSYRDKSPSAFRGFVGFGGSFRGLWFQTAHGGAHAKRPNNKPNLHHAALSIARRAPALKDATLLHTDYRAHAPGAGCIVYCDPPYKGTTGYSTGSFSHDEFYATLSNWASSGAIIVVSEEATPIGWVPIRGKARKHMLRPRDGKEQPYRLEGLWVPKSQQFLWPRFADTP